MTAIDFYILAQDSRRSVEQLVCQLAEKAYMQNNFVYIQSQSAEQANNLDELLWHFKPASFLPHLNLLNISDENNKKDTDFGYPIILNTAENIEEIISITTKYNVKNSPKLIINLTPKINDSFNSFQRLIEVVDKNDSSKQAARERFRFYKEKGYKLTTHNL